MATVKVTGTEMGIEQIAWRFRQQLYPDDPDRAARLSGYVEQIFDLNPGLAEVSHNVPVGTEIVMPDAETETPIGPNRLWG